MSLWSPGWFYLESSPSRHLTPGKLAGTLEIRGKREGIEALVTKINLDELERRALVILEENRAGRWTLPSRHLYPHLWSWDSAFVSLGLALHDRERSLGELESVMEAQWTNGMVPHIRFNPAVDQEYQPNASYWGSREASEGSPRDFDTSGIMQPPVHALALESLVIDGASGERESELYRRIHRWHRYLMTDRDPEGTGTITILHPWESGLDNSPRWDESLHGYELERVPEYRRVDQGKVDDPGERPLKADYDRYIDLLLRLRSVGYDARRLPPDYPFRIKDVLISGIFIAANEALSRIAHRLGTVEEREEVASWTRRARDGFEPLFRWKGAWEDLNFYVDHDLVRERQIRVLTCAGTVAALAGFPSGENPGSWLAALLQGPFHQSGRASPALFPSTAFVERAYEARRYWRGPIWININWFLERALRQAGREDMASGMRLELFELVAEQDFREYYEPASGEGLGAKHFSWTAALLIDLIRTHRRVAG